MSYSPYIANMQSWKNYFKQRTKEHKKFYTIPNSSQHGEKMDAIKLVSPTEQIVEQAKSSLKRMREDDDARYILPPPTKKRKTFPVRRVGGTKKGNIKKPNKSKKKKK